jgi:sialidase-1
VIRKSFPFIVLCILNLLPSCRREAGNPFWGDGRQLFEVQEVFRGERFPNVVVAMDGSIVASWGRTKFMVRRSEDGGATWGPVITVADPGFHGGGLTVDENSGAIFAFVEEGHPIAPLSVYKSTDHGLTWEKVDATILPDINGNVPSMHMNERGITLRYGEHAGRIIRPARSYGGGNDREYWPEHYSNAIYSDDGGKTWITSEPFPARGTGEAALEELSDGRIYYNSRRHLSTDGLNPRMRHIAWSFDGGHTWQDLTVSEELPDGDQDRDYGLMGGLVRLPLDDHDILIFSNIDSPSGRRNGTVWASFDGGKTWPVKRSVGEGGFAYSSMAAGRPGTSSEGWIYLMYEGGDPYGYAYIARFNLAWLTGGRHWKEFIPNSHTSEIKPALFTDDHVSEGFLAPLDDGTVMLLFRLDPGLEGNHVGSAGHIAKIIYDPVQDTWSEPETVYNSHRYDDRNIHGGVTKDGRVVLFFRRYDPAGRTTEGLYFIFSDDNGQTWSDLQTSETMFGIAGTGQMFYNPDIGKYCTMEYLTNKTGILFSNDGSAWEESVIVAEDKNVALTEIAGAWCRNNRIIALIRDNASRHGYPLLQVESYDNGLTWTEPQQTNIPPGKKWGCAPQLIYDESRDLLIALNSDRHSRPYDRQSLFIYTAKPSDVFGNPENWILRHELLRPWARSDFDGDRPTTYSFYGYPTIAPISDSEYLVVFSERNHMHGTEQADLYYFRLILNDINL